MVDGALRPKPIPASQAAASLAYIPHSAALLQCYAQRFAPVDLNLFFLSILHRAEPVEETADRLMGADVVGLSCYVWNVRYSLLLAQALKQRRPEIVVVPGGPQVPDYAEHFLRSHRCVDLVCHGEGEETFLEVLSRVREKDWRGVLSTSFIDADGSFVTHKRRPRIKQLDQIPSPMLSGVYERLMAQAPGQGWLATWETNRGCPFACSFCDWGSATASKVLSYSDERLDDEIEWLVVNNIHHLFVCDANFGILPRDVESAAPIHSEDFTAPYQESEPRRTQSPDVAWQRLKHHISPICGVVKNLVETQRDSEDLLHSFDAGHSVALGPQTLPWLRRSLRIHASGNGASAAAARTSALCEALERECGSFGDYLPRRTATLEELADAAVDPRACLNFSESQYNHRDAINAAHADEPSELVPRRFCERTAIDWTPVWSLTQRRVRFLPASLCAFGHPDVDRHFICAAEPSGCATGANLGEAVVHAFLELVERDSCAIWWYNQVRRPGIDLDSFADPFLDRAQSRLARDGRAVWALDISADLGIPVVAAVSRRVDGGPTERTHTPSGTSRKKAAMNHPFMAARL